MKKIIVCSVFLLFCFGGFSQEPLLKFSQEDAVKVFPQTSITCAEAFVIIDANSDGVLTFTEVLAVAPDLTEDLFASIDTNSDGVWSLSEFAAAWEAGLFIIV